MQNQILFPAFGAKKVLQTVLLFLTVIAISFFGSISPAVAHDALVDSDPKDGAVLEELPAEITLSFNNEIWNEPGSYEIEITDPNNGVLTLGETLITGETVTQSIEPGQAASGTLSVKWRVTSSDSHPISGEFSFEISGGTSNSDDSEVTDEPQPISNTDVLPEIDVVPDGDAVIDPAEEDANSFWINPWLGGTLLIALLVVMTLPIVLILRNTRKTSKTKTDSETDSAPEPQDK